MCKTKGSAQKIHTSANRQENHEDNLHYLKTLQVFINENLNSFMFSRFSFPSGRFVNKTGQSKLQRIISDVFIHSVSTAKTNISKHDNKLPRA